MHGCEDTIPTRFSARDANWGCRAPGTPAVVLLMMCCAKNRVRAPLS